MNVYAIILVRASSVCHFQVRIRTLCVTHFKCCSVYELLPVIHMILPLKGNVTYNVRELFYFGKNQNLFSPWTAVLACQLDRSRSGPSINNEYNIEKVTTIYI